MAHQPYAQKVIAGELEQRELAGKFQPRHIEAIMRAELGTLNHLSAAEFSGWVSGCIDYIEEIGVDDAESIARSFGL
jgi:hypothetical protein